MPLVHIATASGVCLRRVELDARPAMMDSSGFGGISEGLLRDSSVRSIT